jgi:murein DD-endopeptidase MepM/ murein hydrolase activator NlpD
MKRTLILTAMAALLAVLMPVTSLSANPREEKDRVDERVEELTREFEGLDEELARVIAEKESAEEAMPEAEDALTQAQDELDEARRKDEELAARMTSAQNAQEDLRSQIDDGEQEMEDSQQAVSKIGRQAYQNSGVTSDVALLLQMATSDSGAAGFNRVDSAVRSQQRTITRLSEQRATNKNNQDRLDAVAEEIEDLKEEAAQVVLTKAAAEEEARRRKSDLDTLIDTKDRASRTIEDNKSKTEEQLRREKEEQERLVKELERWEEEAEEKGVSLPGTGDLRNPAPGFPITSPFGYRIHPITQTRRLHTGTDFGTPCGTPIHAAGDGVVVSAGWAGGYGNRVVVSHGRTGGSNVASAYSHNTRLTVSPGDRVSQGDVIALAGTTGSSTGCHLHFEIMQGGGYVNPMPFIE